MAQKLNTSVMNMIEDARTRIEEVDVAAAMSQMNDESVLIVDIRDIRERKREGFIPGSLHCPRGMVEFWVDPESPYFKEEFATHSRFLFHCALDWRSALTVDTIDKMGFTGAAHIKGGFKAWKEADGPVEQMDKQPKL